MERYEMRRAELEKRLRTCTSINSKPSSNRVVGKDQLPKNAFGGLLIHTSTTTVLGLRPPSSNAYHSQAEDVNQFRGGIDESRQSSDGKGDHSVIERVHRASPAQSTVWYPKQRDSVARDSLSQKLMELSSVKSTDGGSIGRSPFFTRAPEAVKRTDSGCRSGGSSLSSFFTSVPGGLRKHWT